MYVHQSCTLTCSRELRADDPSIIRQAQQLACKHAILHDPRLQNSFCRGDGLILNLQIINALVGYS